MIFLFFSFFDWEGQSLAHCSPSANNIFWTPPVMSLLSLSLHLISGPPQAHASEEGYATVKFRSAGAMRVMSFLTVTHMLFRDAFEDA